MADLLRFHACIYAPPAAISAGSEQVIAGCRVTTLNAQQQDLMSAMSISFDAVAGTLSQLPRMFFEPDGSFVWVAPAGDPAWQIDGMLYDRGPALAYVELKGACSPAALDELLHSLGWPETPLVFQLVREAVLLGETDFRLVAAAMA